MLLYQRVLTDRTTPNQKPEIVISNNEKGTCMFIDVAISGDRNVIKKEVEKILKCKHLATANRVYVEFRNLSYISCAVLLPYLSFFASLFVPLVALSSTNSFSFCTHVTRADPSGSAVCGVGLQPFAC